MRRCNFCLLPSCSEGQSQSVVECINQGVIPIVSRASGLNVKDFGLYIEPCTIQRIVELVSLASNWSLDKCREYSKLARFAVKRDYSESQFSINLQSAIEAIIGKQ